MTSSYIMRKNTMRQKNRNDTAVMIGKMYLFCLTFNMIAPLKFLQSFVGAAANSFDFVLHVIGMMMIFFSEGGRFSLDNSEEADTVRYFIKMVAWFSFSSVIMAVVMQMIYGNYGSENAFQGIRGMLLYWFQFAMILVYNHYLFGILSIDEIERILKLQVIVLMFIGYFQMAVMAIGRPFANLYDYMNVLGVLNYSSKLPKLPLTGNEGAYAGYIMGILVFPFLYGVNLANKDRNSLLVYIVLWLPLVYMTYSSAAYILFTVTTLGYLFYYGRTRGLSKSIVSMVSLILIVGIFIIVFGNQMLRVLPKEISDNIQYIFLEKITDTENGSTVMRSVPLYINLGAFKEFPLLGVGNGCQGYFLEKYIPATMYTAKGLNAEKWLGKWTQGISNGAVFWPSILSGYGIVGTVLYARYIYLCEVLIRKKREKIGSMYYMYRLALAGILLAGFATDFVSRYYIWFAMSIPLIPQVTRDDRFYR